MADSNAVVSFGKATVEAGVEELFAVKTSFEELLV